MLIKGCTMIDIQGGRSTPRVLLDYDSHRFLIEGQSFPENSSNFFLPIIDWFKEYLEEKNVNMILDIKLLYVNTSSTKALFYILDLLDKAYNKGKNVSVNWYYDSENEMARETGLELLEDFKFPYRIIEV